MGVQLLAHINFTFKVSYLEFYVVLFPLFGSAVATCRKLFQTNYRVNVFKNCFDGELWCNSQLLCQTLGLVSAVVVVVVVYWFWFEMEHK